MAGTIIVMFGMMALISCMMTTKEQRAEARRKFARWNPLWQFLIVVQLAMIFWPHKH